jgi:MoxR-like ATPase
MSQQSVPLEEEAGRFKEKVQALRGELAKVVVGQKEILDFLITAVFADGHVLLEGLPGTGKTLMIKSLARVLSLAFNRIQFTPDLMPADITGTTVISTTAAGERSFTFEAGPLFTNLLLSDEINRAGPKTQSALLQAMQEREVTLFGKHYPLPVPFLVFATQNPIELAGTYPLPEAQLDRFLLKVNVPSPDEQDMYAIADLTTGADLPDVAPVLSEKEIISFRNLVRRIPVAEPVLRAVTAGVMSTRPDTPSASKATRRFVRYGVSPRGLQSLLLAAKVRACLDGRFNVSLDDVTPYWLPALRHRIILDVGASMEGVTAESILEELRPSLTTA